MYIVKDLAGGLLGVHVHRGMGELAEECANAMCMCRMHMHIAGELAEQTPWSANVHSGGVGRRDSTHTYIAGD